MMGSLETSSQKDWNKASKKRDFRLVSSGGKILHKVGGSNQRLRRAKTYLWQGLIDEAIAEFDDLKKKQARNFQNYLRKHRARIPDYQTLPRAKYLYWFGCC